MEAAGLVQRRPDEFDARVRRVYLTRAGNRLIGQVRSRLALLEQEALGPNSDEELATTVRALRRMKETLLRMFGEEGEELGTNEQEEAAAAPED
jgi:DNA-binding MarR family transcriptional regulator